MIQAAIRRIPPAFMFRVPSIVLAHKGAEKASHMIPFARLYAGMSVISDSLTVLPDQNHIGFLRFMEYIPIPVKRRLTGTIMIIHMILSI